MGSVRQRIIIYETADRMKDSIAGEGFSDSTFNIILLPIPSFIADELKKQVAKNQNIGLANTPAEADYVLYLNYFVKKIDQTAGFAFYYRPSLDKLKSQLFSKDPYLYTYPSITEKARPGLVRDLYNYTLKSIRYKTTAWKNGYLRR